MRVLADENISAGVIGGLRAGGHDVLSAKEVMRGASDVAILSRAQVQGGCC